MNLISTRTIWLRRVTDRHHYPRHGRRLLRTDELERRIHIEGAAIGLALAVPAATVYALFEQLLPPLRGHWVAVALLLAWWSGWLVAAARYR